MTLAGGFHYRHHFMGERAEAWRARATEMVRVGLGTRTQVSGFMIRASRHCLIAPHYVQTEPGKRRGLGAAHLGPRGCPPRGAGAQVQPHASLPFACWLELFGERDLIFLYNGFHEAGTTDGRVAPTPKSRGTRHVLYRSRTSEVKRFLPDPATGRGSGVFTSLAEQRKLC